ncbi:sulfatase-like hydrolase/transferase [Pseudactinotalea sp. Z1748]|uniref:sulfatase-like hydrolase/transferase n=1 Tax=Pseudactinotalea sp. Z1748 TaxID=3413027 RepID=UPI003C7A14B7
MRSRRKKPTSAAQPRNILFLMTDQHRLDTLGFYDGTPAHTPVLDGLAQNSTVFTSAYTPSAICTPARASLITGLHPFEHGLLANYEWNSGHREELPTDHAVFSHRLRAQGYNVGHVGKWHVGHRRGPAEHGFDGEHIAGALNDYTNPGYLAWLERHGHPPVGLTDQIHTTLPDGSQGHLLAARLRQPTEATFEQYLADLTIERIGTYAAEGKPFYLNCHFFGPHLPYLLPDEWFDLIDPDQIELPASMAETFADKPEIQRTYSRYWGADGFDAVRWRKLIAIYRGYVALIDHQVGRILAALRDHGLQEDTVVCFTADHGEFTGAHRLNDKGPAMYDDIYRIPALVHNPGVRGDRCDDFVSLLDFHATILDVAGIHPAASRGTSLLDPSALRERREIVAEFHGHHFGYSQRMLRDRRFKLIINPEGTDELYDLQSDPHELRNVVAVPAYGEVVTDLRRRLYRILRDRGDRFAQWMAMMSGIPEADRIRPETAVESHVQ